MRLLRNRSNWISVLLSCLLLFRPSTVVAQTETVPTSIQVAVIAGEGAINGLNERTSNKPVIIEVQDQNQHPLTGAAVVFTLPTEGPSGEFSNGSKTLTVFTDGQGRAATTGLKVNGAAGKLLIHINASYKGQSARVVVTQFNMLTPLKKSRGGSGKTIAILILVGAAVAGGVIAGTQMGGHSSSGSSSTAATSTPIGITPGTGTVGPPH
jgi:hypothetical protein